MAAIDGERLSDAIKLAQSDSNEVLRKEGIRLAAKLKPSGAAGQLATALESGSLSEKQNAFETLGTLNDVSADEILSQWLDKLRAGQVSKELKLDILEAASKRSASAIKTRLEKYEAAQSKDDSLIGFREALFGGDPAAGRKIFFERAEAACMRCHKVNSEGGDVGPDLTGIGTRQNREYILESILFPNKQIAAGSENLLVTLKNGMAYAGVVKSEDDKELVLNSPEDGLVKLKKSDIQSREKGLSAMPEGMGSLLSKQDLRNLVEFLASLK